MYLWVPLCSHCGPAFSIDALFRSGEAWCATPLTNRSRNGTGIPFRGGVAVYPNISWKYIPSIEKLTKLHVRLCRICHDSRRGAIEMIVVRSIRCFSINLRASHSLNSPSLDENLSHSLGLVLTLPCTCDPVTWVRQLSIDAMGISH